VAAAEAGRRDTGRADAVEGQVVDAPPPPNPLPHWEEGFYASQLRALVADCLVLWGVRGNVVVCGAGVEIAVDQASLQLLPAPVEMRPVRWLLHTPERRASNRPPRAAPSIGAVLTVLRDALGAERGNRLVIGATAP
jgi:hypothetical protein